MYQDTITLYLDSLLYYYNIMFDEVPDELLICIFTFLSFKEKDFIRIRNVCK